GGVWGAGVGFAARQPAIDVLNVAAALADRSDRRGLPRPVTLRAESDQCLTPHSGIVAAGAERALRQLPLRAWSGAGRPLRPRLIWDHRARLALTSRPGLRLAGPVIGLGAVGRRPI